MARDREAPTVVHIFIRVAFLSRSSSCNLELLYVLAELLEDVHHLLPVNLPTSVLSRSSQLVM
jgi:hypothetical protein